LATAALQALRRSRLQSNVRIGCPRQMLKEQKTTRRGLPARRKAVSTSPVPYTLSAATQPHGNSSGNGARHHFDRQGRLDGEIRGVGHVHRLHP
jgi:hypothetical protein